MVVESTNFARETANKKDLVRLICTRTNLVLTQSLIMERRNKILIDSLCNQTTGFFVEHPKVAKKKAKDSSTGYCFGRRRTQTPKTISRDTVREKDKSRATEAQEQETNYKGGVQSNYTGDLFSLRDNHEPPAHLLDEFEPKSLSQRLRTAS